MTYKTKKRIHQKGGLQIHEIGQKIITFITNIC